MTHTTPTHERMVLSGYERVPGDLPVYQRVLKRIRLIVSVFSTGSNFSLCHSGFGAVQLHMYSSLDPKYGLALFDSIIAAEAQAEAEASVLTEADVSWLVANRFERVGVSQTYRREFDESLIVTVRGKDGVMFLDEGAQCIQLGQKFTTMAVFWACLLLTGEKL